MKIVQFVKGTEQYGASVSIRHLSLELSRRGHEVVLLTFEGRSVGPLPEHTIRTIEFKTSSKYNPRSYSRLRTIFQNERPDIVHTHLSAATLIGCITARLARVPVVATVHGMNLKWTYMFADRVLAVSEAGRRHLLAQGLRADKISVVHNGIPIPPLPTAAERKRARESLGFTDSDLLIGAVSRADFNKGVQDAIAAMTALLRRVPRAHFLFAGDGSYMPELQTLTRALGLRGRVHFLGYRDDIGDVLSALNLFLCPSLKEAMGISIVEAMATGLPIVATNVGGIPEVVDGDTGMLVPPRDPLALADACATLLCDEKCRAALGANARKRAETHFSVKVFGDAAEEAYRLTIDRKIRR